MSTYTILALVILRILGGIIAWVGDVLGYRLGKSRRSLFGLRPRSTARLVAVSVGVALPLLTLLERAPADVRPVIQRIWAAGEEVPIHPADEQALRRMLEAHDAYAETRALAVVL